MRILAKLFKRNKPKLNKLPPIKLPEQPVEILPVVRPIKGRIVKTKPATYDPNIRHKGGRIVKAMSPSLRKLKEDGEKHDEM